MKISHISWNLLGLSFPLLMAAVAVPQLINKLGSEKFGLLALAWGLIGYAGALDLGVGRALTQIISRLRGRDEISQIPDYLTTAIYITFVASVFVAFLFLSSIFFDLSDFLYLKNTDVHEINFSILILCVAIPAQAMSATYKGVNEAYLNFKGISILRVVLGFVNFGGPFFVAFFSNNLIWIFSVLTVSRLSALLIYRKLAISCIKKDSPANKKGLYSFDIAKKLFSFGGWITVSSVVSPLLMQADRFFIAYSISAAAVTVYVLPYEMVVQSLIVVGAISTVVFPNLSRMIGVHSHELNRYFNKWMLVVVLIMIPICIAIAGVLPLILPWWIGENVDSKSIIVGQILCIGVFINSVGSMLYAFIHAKGRPDVTAKIHMVEFPIFILLLYVMLNNFGVIGAAWAWVIRMMIDSAALFYVNKRV